MKINFEFQRDYRVLKLQSWDERTFNFTFIQFSIAIWSYADRHQKKRRFTVRFGLLGLYLVIWAEVKEDEIESRL